WVVQSRPRKLGISVEAVIIIAAMKPSAGTAAHNRRRLAVLLTILLGCADASAKDETCSTLPRDPRLDELLKADPNDGRIGVESDAGELGRDGHADLQGNVRIRMGQRRAHAAA